jgi:DNA-nicking Smr family endonuclease
MKPRKSSLTFRSFQDLKDLIKIGPPSVSKPLDPKPNDKKEEADIPEPEQSLFSKAMAGVTPIARENFVERNCRVSPPERFRENEDTETLSKLMDLVKYGKGFNVADTPEYIEGTGYHVHPEIAKRLHEGEYSIEAHVDLHGYTADAAKEIFEEFLKWAVFAGKKGVLIIHGRGLCSPAKPVLKRKVEEWLTRGPWRKWVVAYSSAKIYDGGAGATYVLLRERPVSKRFKVGKWKLNKPHRSTKGHG